MADADADDTDKKVGLITASIAYVAEIRAPPGERIAVEAALDGRARVGAFRGGEKPYPSLAAPAVDGRCSCWGLR